MKSIKILLESTFGLILIAGCGEKVIHEQNRTQLSSDGAELLLCNDLNQTGKNCSQADFKLAETPKNVLSEKNVKISWSKIEKAKSYVVAYSKEKACTLLEKQFDKITTTTYEFSFAKEGDFFICLFAVNDKNQKYPALNSGMAIKVDKIPKATLAVSKAVIDFGSHIKTTESNAKITLKNIGTAKATAIVFSDLNEYFKYKGGNFPGTEGTCGAQLDIGEQCLINVAFKADDIRTVSTKVQVKFDNSVSKEDKIEFELTGKTIQPALLSSGDSSSFEFGTVAVSANKDLEITIVNNGDSEAKEMDFTQLPAPFTLQSKTCTDKLAAKAQCKVVIKFTPETASSVEAMWGIDFNNGVQEEQLTLVLKGN